MTITLEKEMEELCEFVIGNFASFFKRYMLTSETLDSVLPSSGRINNHDNGSDGRTWAVASFQMDVYIFS